MSLWLDSLLDCSRNSGEDLGKRAKCILVHLSMSVPRSWWEHMLDTGKIRDDHFNILKDLRIELLEIPELPEQPEFDLLVALAFIDENIEDRELKYGTIYSQHSVEEYFSEAKKILNNRKDINKLSAKFKRKANLLA